MSGGHKVSTKKAGGYKVSTLKAEQPLNHQTEVVHITNFTETVETL